MKPVEIFSDSVKTVKGEKYGVRTLVSYLSPSEYLARALGLNFRNLCPFASEACAAVCLGEHSGRMSFDGPKNARMRRTILYHLAPELFRAQFARETDAAKKKKLAEAVQARAFEIGTHVALGEAIQPVAVRKGVSGAQIGLADVYWNIRKN